MLRSEAQLRHFICIYSFTPHNYEVKHYYYSHFTYEETEIQSSKEMSADTWITSGESGIWTCVCLTPITKCLPHYSTPPFFVSINFYLSEEVNIR